VTNWVNITNVVTLYVSNAISGLITNGNAGSVSFNTNLSVGGNIYIGPYGDYIGSHGAAFINGQVSISGAGDLTAQTLAGGGAFIVGLNGGNIQSASTPVTALNTSGGSSGQVATIVGGVVAWSNAPAGLNTAQSNILNNAVTNGQSGVTLSGTITSSAFTGTNTITGTTIFSGQISGVVTNANPEATTYWLANKIADLSAQSALVGMENELKIWGVWSNVVDIIPLHPRFNPAAGHTFLGRTYNTNFTVADWGCTNFTAAININVPYMTNGSMCIVWGKLPQTAFGTAVGNVNCGLAGWSYNGLNDEFFQQDDTVQYQTLISFTNNVQWSSDVYGLIWRWTGIGTSSADYNYDNSAGNGLGGQPYDVKTDVVSFNTNGNVTFWNNSALGKLGYSGGSPIGFTNVMGFASGFTNFWIGKDPMGQRNSSLSQIMAVFIMNNEANSNEVVALNRAARWLDPATIDLIPIADSRMYPAGTNCTMWYLQTGLNGSKYRVYNWAWSGKLAGDYNASSTILPILQHFSNIGCVQQTIVPYCLGVNDMGGGGAATATFPYVTNFIYRLPLDFQVEVGTIFQVYTNQSLFGGISGINLNTQIGIYNSMILSNACLFPLGVFDEANLVSQAQMFTNSVVTMAGDGVHELGFGSKAVQQANAHMIIAVPHNVYWSNGVAIGSY